MADIFIYSGLGIMLLGALYGIYVAIRGIRSRKDDGSGMLSAFNFQFGSVNPEMKRLIINWGIIMVAGFIVTCIGLAIGL